MAGVGFVLATLAIVLPFGKSESCCPTDQPTGLNRISTIELVDLPATMMIPKSGILRGKVTFSRRRPKHPIVLYLVRVGGELPLQKKMETIVIRQRGARFQPDFVVVTRKQKIQFVNDELSQIDHNVYFLGGEKKDLGIFSKGKALTHEFSKAGEIDVYCSIHSQMDGKIFVTPNSQYVILGADESDFTISNVPAGDWELRSWQKVRRFKDVALKVTVSAGKQSTLSVKMAR